MRVDLLFCIVFNVPNRRESNLGPPRHETNALPRGWLQQGGNKQESFFFLPCIITKCNRLGLHGNFIIFVY